MAFFSEGQGRVKLLMLYIMHSFRTPVTREQLYTAMVRVDDTGFFEMSELLAELIGEQYALAVPARGRQLLFLTEKGARLCEEFEREIARSVRDEVIGYANDERENVRRSNCVVSDAVPQPDGSWVLTLSILEKDSVLFEITLHLPDSGSTYRAQQVWAADADGIYIDMLSRLTKKEES
ncbi:MAG: DUF4364 family protein [Clostridia bacterium]|nr:DUF4364 family protein [Clostridia bacterium]